MTAEPQVSVVLVNWNSRNLLEQALTSLHQTTTAAGVPFETIVVDNGSRDGSVNYIRDAWPGVQLIPLDSNRGFAAANNIGFKSCRGQYVLLLNVDTIAQPTMVSGLIECMAEHPEAGCVGARHLNADRSLQWSMDDFPSLLNDTLRYTDLYRLPFLQAWLRRKYPAFSAHDVEREVGWVNGACLMVRRKVIEQVGGLDEYFFVYAEELDWCYRMWQGGWTVRFTPRAEVIHLLGGTFSPSDGKRTILLYQSLRRYYRRHYSDARYRAVSTMVALNALWRLIALSVLHAGSLVGMRVRPAVWELIAQQQARTSWWIMYRTWWKTIWVTPDDPVRP